MADEDTAAWQEFRDTINMTAAELEKWLGTEESKKVGQKGGKGESTGHASGRRIVDLLRSKKSDLSDEDYRHMRKVVGYAHRHPGATALWRHQRICLALFADELGPRPV
jgi:hypothetical protein